MITLPDLCIEPNLFDREEMPIERRTKANACRAGCVRNRENEEIDSFKTTTTGEKSHFVPLPLLHASALQQVSVIFLEFWFQEENGDWAICFNDDGRHHRLT